jgi:hypothetical protein
MINTGVTECVSVDSARKKGFFAVQSGMVISLRFISGFPIILHSEVITNYNSAEVRLSGRQGST